MPRPIGLFAVVILWLFTVGRVFAESALLDAIPEDALGLAVINNLSDASAKVQKVAQKMNLPVPELLPMAKMFLGATEGIDDQGSLAAIALAGDDDDSMFGLSIAVLVPVTDYKAFIKQFDADDTDGSITEVKVMGQQAWAAKKGDFAVFSGPDGKELVQSILASTKSVAATLAPVKQWMTEQQAALVLTPKGKKRLFEAIGKAIPDAGDAKDDDSEKDSENDDDQQTRQQALQLFKRLLTSSEPQVTHLGFGIRIDEQTALHLAARMMFASDSAISKWADKVKPPKGSNLLGLPADKFVIAYGGAFFHGTSEFSKLMELASNNGLQTMGLDDEARKQYFTAFERHQANLVSSCGLLGTLRPGDSITSTSTVVEHVKDAKQHLKVSREMFQLLANAPVAEESKLPTYAVNEVTIGDLKAIEIVMDMSAMTKGLQGAGPAEGFLQGFMSGLFGNEGKMRVYMAVADESHLASAYSKPLLERAVAHVRSGKTGLEADSQIAKTNALLPGGSQWTAYVSPQGLVQWIDTLMRQALPAEMKFKLPPFPPSDPIGLAAKVSVTQLDAELVLPESVLAGIGQYVGLVQQMFQGGAAPLP